MLQNLPERRDLSGQCRHFGATKGDRAVCRICRQRYLTGANVRVGKPVTLLLPFFIPLCVNDYRNGRLSVYGRVEIHGKLQRAYDD